MGRSHISVPRRKKTSFKNDRNTCMINVEKMNLNMQTNTFLYTHTHTQWNRERKHSTSPIATNQKNVILTPLFNYFFLFF